MSNFYSISTIWLNFTIKINCILTGTYNKWVKRVPTLIN